MSQTLHGTAIYADQLGWFERLYSLWSKQSMVFQPPKPRCTRSPPSSADDVGLQSSAPVFGSVFGSKALASPYCSPSCLKDTPKDSCRHRIRTPRRRLDSSVWHTCWGPLLRRRSNFSLEGMAKLFPIRLYCNYRIGAKPISQSLSLAIGAVHLQLLGGYATS